MKRGWLGLTKLKWAYNFTLNLWVELDLKEWQQVGLV